jgi:hypothetical protein
VAVASLAASLLGMWILTEAAWFAVTAGLLARRVSKREGVTVPGEAIA